MKLNPKQQRFCEEYLIDMNAKAAAIRAGYSKKTAKEMGYENLTKPHLQDYITELQNKIQSQTNITIVDTVKFIKEVSDQARDGEDLSNALKGADMLMKHLGGYEQDKEDKTPTSHNLTLNIMPKK